MKDLIIVKQLPIIEENLKKLSEDITVKVNNATSLICSEETVKEVKKVRAELNSDFKELEAQRKFVKEQILEPYMSFEEIYKTYVSDKFKTADSTLKDKIDEVESEQKKVKSIEISEYFIEYAKSKNLNWIVDEPKYYVMANINVTLTASIKSLKEQAKAFIDKLIDDLELIDTQENKEEILVEYRKDLNVSRAIKEVVDRHFILEQVKQSEKDQVIIEQKEEIVIEKVEEVVQAPVVEEEVYEFNFKVTCTKTKAKALKEFLENGGYIYE